MQNPPLQVDPRPGARQPASPQPDVADIIRCESLCRDAVTGPFNADEAGRFDCPAERNEVNVNNGYATTKTVLAADRDGKTKPPFVEKGGKCASVQDAEGEEEKRFTYMTALGIVTHKCTETVCNRMIPT